MDKLNQLELAVREHADFYSLFDQLIKYEDKEGSFCAQHIAIAMFVHTVIQDQGYFGFEYTWPDVMTIVDKLYLFYKQEGLAKYQRAIGSNGFDEL